ncbi:transposase [Corynebacterium striatum]|nr:transposase [Corynebacterium striatum]
MLKLNRSSFYKWVQTREKRRLKTCSDALIGARIKSIFDDEHGLYGAKRIAASLNDDKDFPPINHKKVARIMKSMGLKGFSKRHRCITTRRKPGHRPPMRHYQAQAWPPRHARFSRPQIHSQRAKPRLCRRHHLPAL